LAYFDCSFADFCLLHWISCSDKVHGPSVLPSIKDFVIPWPQFRLCQGQQSRWFCRHSASNRLFAKHDVSLFPVARAYLGHSIAFLALVFWILQLLTGFLLLGLLAWNLDVQYSELISIIFHGNFVWLVRMLHMLGANFVVISTIIHFAKAVA